MTLMTDEELTTQLRIQDHSEMCLAAAGRIEALTGQLAAKDAVQVALVEALTIAANRLQRLAIEFDAGTRMFLEVSEWADEARAAIARVKGGAA